MCEALPFRAGDCFGVVPSSEFWHQQRVFGVWFTYEGRYPSNNIGAELFSTVMFDWSCQILFKLSLARILVYILSILSQWRHRTLARR